MWVVRSSNGYAGYHATLPKGHADEALSLRFAGIKEVLEVSGLQVAVAGFAGDVARTSTVARY